MTLKPNYEPVSMRILFWLPRFICILAILFISMFALDAFEPGLSVWEQIAHFFMHLIPSFILTALLLVAWKRELIGGIGFALIGIGFSPLVFMHNYEMNQSIGMSLGIIGMITFPFIIVGGLFILSHFKRQRH